MGGNSTGAPLLNARQSTQTSKWADVPPEIRTECQVISHEMQNQGILDGTRARVCVVLDVSASMQNFYQSGKVQTLLNKSLAMARCLDDDGEIEIFPFGEWCDVTPIQANFENFQSVISSKILSQGYQGATNYAAAVSSVREFYFKDTSVGQKKFDSETAVFVIFVTDGEPNREVEHIHSQFKASSYQPVFWKIIALGSAHFKLLQEIDDAPIGPNERLLDNSDYKQISDPSKLTAAMLVEEFPQYLHEAFTDHQLLLQAPVLNDAIIAQNADRVSERRGSKRCCMIS